MKQMLLPLAILVVALAGSCGDSSGAPESCADCVGTNTGPDNMPDLAVSCDEMADGFECTCVTQSGATTSVFLSEAGCQ